MPRFTSSQSFAVSVSFFEIIGTLVIGPWYACTIFVSSSLVVGRCLANCCRCHFVIVCVPAVSVGPLPARIRAILGVPSRCAKGPLANWVLAEHSVALFGNPTNVSVFD